MIFIVISAEMTNFGGNFLWILFPEYDKIYSTPKIGENEEM